MLFRVRSADGSLLATGCLDGRVHIWRVLWQDSCAAALVICAHNTRSALGGALQCVLEGPGGGVDWLQWHPRGFVLLAGSEDYTAWLWNVSDGSCMQVHVSGKAQRQASRAEHASRFAGFCGTQRASQLWLFHARRESRVHCVC